MIQNALDEHIISFLSCHAIDEVYKGACVLHHRSFIRYESGANLAFFNGIWPLESFAEDIDEQIAYFNKKMLPFCWWMKHASQKEALSYNVNNKSLSYHGPYMVLVRKASLPFPDNILNQKKLVVQRVANDQMLKEFAHIIAKVFFPTRRSGYDLYFKTSQFLGFDGPLYHYLVYYDEMPVHASSLYITETSDKKRIGGLWNSATLPEYRRMGISTFSAMQRMKDAQELGAAYITTMLEPDYLAAGYCKKLGFEECYELYPYFAERWSK